MPAEWAEQSMVQLTWPHEDTDWKYCLAEITATYVEMAAAISRHEKLLIVTPYPDDVRALLTVTLTRRQMSNILFHKCPTNDTWARDHGFITLTETDSTAADVEQGIVLSDFRFNGWGEKFPARLDNAINRSLYDSGVIRGKYADNNDFVLEGGSIESDGRGTVLTTACCLMAPHRNQPLTRDGIESQLLHRLHADRILWIDHGHLEGDDTDGHIDTLVRIAPSDTLLYIGCDDRNDSHYEDLRLMEEQLRTLRTIDGCPYRLLRLPMADAIYEGGERLPATYANFLVINDAVLVPTYAQPDNDRLAADVIKEAFPDREIICIDSRAIIRQHGSIHCCTMQFPKGLKIKDVEKQGLRTAAGRRPDITQ